MKKQIDPEQLSDVKDAGPAAIEPENGQLPAEEPRKKRAAKEPKPPKEKKKRKEKKAPEGGAEEAAADKPARRSRKKSEKQAAEKQPSPPEAEAPDFGQPVVSDEEPKKKKKWFIPVAAVIVGLAAAAVGGYYLYNRSLDTKLAEATAALAEGRYDQAAEQYQEISGSRDVDHYLTIISGLKSIENRDTQAGVQALLEAGLSVHINYDLNGGSFINSDRQQEVTYQNAIDFGDLYKARKDYYDFLGWQPVRTVYNPEYDGSIVDLTVKAEYAPTEYSISYANLLGSELENPETYTVETETFMINAPERVGYSFQYWSGVDVKGQPTSIMIQQGSTGNRAYIANWEANKYQVSLVPDGEYGIDTELTVTYDDDYLMPVISKRGYTYIGWSTGDSVYTEGVWRTPNDVTLEPVWELTNYDLTYDYAGGSTPKAPPATYTMLTSDISLPNPTRFGYTFTGWTCETAPQPTPNYVIKTDTVGDLNFHANWLGNSHVVTLNAAGGTAAAAAVDVRFGDAYSLPSPTRTGYKFAGWYDGNTQYSAGTWDLDKDITVTAGWKAKDYKVALDAAGGKCSSSSIDVTFDSAFKLPAPTRYGYTFAGWYYGTTKITDGNWVLDNATDADVDFTLTAQWQSNPHKITLDANGGSCSSSVIDTLFNTAFTLPTPTRTGYKFSGWFSGKTQYGNGTYLSDEDLSLTASWTAKTYQLSLDSAGGSCSSNALTVTYDAAFTLPTPTRTGYTFQGWYSGTSKVTNGTWKTDSNMALTAKWEGNKYTVSLKANGGQVSSSSVSVIFGNTYSLPKPTRVGYDFLGWSNGSKNMASSGTWNTANDVTLTAEWELIDYCIYLDPDGGVCSDKVVIANYGCALSLPTPTRYGYDFVGWYNGNSKYSASQSSWKDCDDIELTARWEGKSVTVYYDDNGGEGVPYSTTVTFGSKYSLSEPTRKGYDFDGWLCGRSFIPLSGTWDIYDSSGISLVAQWSPIEYIIYLDADGGSCSATYVYIYYEDSLYLPTPTREGYTFLGWYDGNTKYSASQSTWKDCRDLKLTAKWEGNSMTVYFDANGGSGVSSYTTMTYDSRYSLPTPSRTGYTFEGWYLDGYYISSSGIWSIDSYYALTLVAEWSPETYRIYLDAGEGSVSPSHIDVCYGEYYSLPDAYLDGAYFNGWYGTYGYYYPSGYFDETNDVYLRADYDYYDYYDDYE